MAQHSVSLDVGSALALPHSCAACGSASLLPVSDDEGVMFTCPRCGHGWILEMGVITPADPDRSPERPDEAADRRLGPRPRDPT